MEDLPPHRPQPTVCVAICTCDRPDLLRSAIAALSRQADRDFEVLVVNQGNAIDPQVLTRHRGGAAVRVIADSGRGLSRSRNLAWRETSADWVAFVDDDCVVDADWISHLKSTIIERPDCSLIAGEVVPLNTPKGPYLPTGVFHVRRELVRHGRWRRPLSVGHGVCMAVRREAIATLGGWDERLGVGSQRFPAAEDEDFNYRLLQAGGFALATPELRAGHQQWRTQTELVPLFRDYMIGRGGLAAKQLRSGDLSGGSWLLTLAFADCFVLLASAVRFAPRFRLRIGRSSVRGLLIGVRRGLGTAW